MGKRDCILGMDIGGTNFRMGLVDRDLRCYGAQVLSSNLFIDSDDVPGRIVNTIVQYLAEYRQSWNVCALSVGFPSLIDASRRRLLSSTNFPGLDGVDIVEVLQKQMRIPVFIEHDAFYLLAYDIFDRGIENKGTIAGFYFGTGLGNAIYIGGAPYTGKNGAACELGHLPIFRNTFPCSCGNRGCIEMFCCGKALERIVQEDYPDTPIGEAFLRHGEDDRLKDFVDAMAVAIAAEGNILDPDCVFLGGGLIKMRGFPKERLQHQVMGHLRKPYPAGGFQMFFSRFNPENGIIGAAIRGYEQLASL